jgi:hypothetical protein
MAVIVARTVLCDVGLPDVRDGIEHLPGVGGGHCHSAPTQARSPSAPIAGPGYAELYGYRE